MAAVLAVGDGAVLSHHSAAALWGIRQTARAHIDVTVAGPRRSRPGLRLHRARLPSDEVTLVQGITVTTAPRTLLDLAAVLPQPALERAVNEAEVLRLADALSLEDLVARHPRRHGVPALRRVVDAGLLGATVTRSEFEDRFLAFLAGVGLPRPDINASIELANVTVEVDCLWPTARVIVELDGYASHGTRDAFERDRLRDRGLQAAGWRVLRLTWRQLHASPATIAAELRPMLAAEVLASAKYPSLRT